MTASPETTVKWSEDIGITKERFERAKDHIEIGGDDRTGKVYHLRDSVLTRIYKRLKANAKDANQLAETGVQERALERYLASFVEGGLNGSMPSVNLGNSCVQGGAGRDHAAKTDWAVDARNDFAKANAKLTQNQMDVLRIIVLCDGSTEEAGRHLGKTGRVRAIQSAVQHLRDAGNSLAKLWGMG